MNTTLFNQEMNVLYQEYHKVTGKNANFGLKLTSGFKKYVNNQLEILASKKLNLLKLIRKINRRKLIKKWIKNQLETTGKTKNKITEDFSNNLGLTISFGIIKQIEQEYNLESRNTLKKGSSHPNLDINYFKEIDTKEKAYWLGFIYADGYIEIDPRNNAKRLCIGSLHKKDKILLERFADSIKANINKIEPDREYFRIRIGNNKLCDDAIKYGVVPRKSLIITYPELEFRKLELAFLLGYFDGDGIQGKSVIKSGSREFLEQIKEKFRIKFNIYLNEPNKPEKHTLCLTLGADLFNEMLDNYEDSLERKRIKLSSWGGNRRK